MYDSNCKSIKICGGHETCDSFHCPNTFTTTISFSLKHYQIEVS